MNKVYKPPGHPDLSPYLVVEGAERMIDFLKQAFDAIEVRRFENPDGSIMHAEVRIGDGLVMLGNSGPNWPPIAQFMHVYVPDVDATYRRALDAGGKSLQEPTTKQGDSDHRGGVMDPCGNSWWIATQQG